MKESDRTRVLLRLSLRVRLRLRVSLREEPMIVCMNEPTCLIALTDFILLLSKRKEERESGSPSPTIPFHQSA